MKIAVATFGDKGSLAYDGKEFTSFGIFPAEQVVNTVGAGDALFSAFIHHFAEGCAPVEALLRAELFASAKIRVSGAAKGFVTAGELEALYRQHGSAILTGMREYTV